MDKVLISNTHLSNIAQAIRNKNKTSDKMTVTEMANAINNIKSGTQINIDGEKYSGEELNLESFIDEGVIKVLGRLEDKNVSTLPYSFSYGSAVVYNNEIHIMGGSTNHYKYNGYKWINVSTLPYEFYGGFAVVYNNEIHILGSGNSSYYKYHYKYDGSTWTKVSTLPYDFYYGSAVVYNNEIHILGSDNNPFHSILGRTAYIIV